MAREDVSKTTLSGAYGGSMDSLSMEDADTSNKNKATLTRGDILIAHNTDTSSHTVTISSVDTAKAARSEDISSESISADEIKAFGPIEFDGWRQTDGNLYFKANNSAVEFAVLESTQL